MKPHALIILIALILSACQVNNTPIVPIATSTLPLTETKPAPTSTETATVIPETVEQRINRIAKEAVAHGAVANDPKTWTWGEAVEFQAIDTDPNSKTDQQLVELDQFMTVLRKEDYQKYLKENPAMAKDTLGHFLRGFMNDSPWASAIDGMAVEQMQEVVDQLNAEQQLYLEIVRRASAKETIKLSQVEIINMETDPEGNVKYDPNWRENGIGAYGMWANNSQNEGFNLDKVSYKKPLFGRTIFQGKELFRYGITIADTEVGDFVGVDMSNGYPAILTLMKDNVGKPHVRITKVVTTSNQPIEVSTSGWDINSFILTPLKIFLTTRYAQNSANWKNDMHALTISELLGHLEWSPQIMTINTPGEHVVDQEGINRIQSMFFDPNTGLRVLGSSEEANRFGVLVGIIFLDKDQVVNFWP